MNHYVKEVLPLCMEKLLTVSKLEEEKLIRRHCEKTVAALEILIDIFSNFFLLFLLKIENRTFLLAINTYYVLSFESR